VYEEALADPDSLAGVVDPDSDWHECEEILGVAVRAYRQVTGNRLPPSRAGAHPAEPSGEEWDFNDMEATATRLPRLARMYGE
jgi:hypothetical protein